MVFFFTNKHMKKKRYYNNTDNFPDQIDSIITRMKIYMGSKLYYEEDISNAITNFIYADVGNDGSEEGIRRAIQLFQNSNQKYPFTAYSFGDEEILKEKRTAYAKNKIYYDSYIGSFVTAKPSYFFMPMISFFNTPRDYQTAKKILFEISSAPIKLDVPIIVGDVTTTFPALITFETIEKGTYAFNFQEQLRAGNIFDIQHFARIEYHDMETDASGIYLVDDMIFELYRLAEEDKSLSDNLYSINIDYITSLSSSDPENGATDIPVDNSIILTFSIGMDESSVENAITLDPYFSTEYTWNNNSTSLVLDPVYDLSSGTVYSIEIDGSAKSWFNQENLNSGTVTIEFTTEG